ncbi:flagellar hook-length control protein FliK [Caballeronia sp. LZ062]|uniref:flagellar hook-length control protein FliK n=1 Tax=unclassified Caballeronia TaxID=2646786 RepID=UPI00285E9A58|nr:MULTISPECIES: flagellar hook-length control protein FliK [unclassified Caballeronia]MDR5855814.1 flagellar hook-length control protein FliK [Caballeronia sp. LZ050]MDR5872399.1 flagellar hook-length control protein FliK [Caballeronia sp. LZ062]
MTGFDSAIATLLAGRTDLVLSAIRAADAVNGAAGTAAGRTTTQAGTSATVDTPDTPASGTAGANPVASAQTELSSVARTLDVISRLSGAASAVIGDAPLWPTPPRPASAFAALTTGLFDTAFSSNAAAVAAARAASQNLPPLPASVLAGELAKTVGESGLFYESHLAQWLAGQRSAASLASEPQARVDPRALSLPFDLASESAPDAAPAFPAFSDFHDAAPTPPRVVEMPQTPQQAAALAASVRDAPASALSHSQSGSANTGNAGAHPAPSESAMQASVAAGVHPATLDIVRQQLDLLANGQFRWQGEAWPGTRFEWEIAREPREGRTQEPEADERAWRTRITLSLPALGTVDAELVLSGERLVARINASDKGAARLAADGAAFARQLDAAGIALASFSVRSIDGAAGIEAGHDAGHAAPKPVRSPLEHLFRASPRTEGGAT